MMLDETEGVPAPSDFELEAMDNETRAAAPWCPMASGDGTDERCIGKQCAWWILDNVWHGKRGGRCAVVILATRNQ
jgi:hypothetical protein